MIFTALNNEELIAYVDQFGGTEIENILIKRLSTELDEIELMKCELDRLYEQVEILERAVRRD